MASLSTSLSNAGQAESLRAIRGNTAIGNTLRSRPFLSLIRNGSPFSVQTRVRVSRTARAEAASGGTPLAAAVSVSPQKEKEQQLQELSVPASFEYNQSMKRHMANPFEYHHELGMYYTRITSNILVGSQPQTPADVTQLVEREGVGVILNVQEEKDSAYWKVDLGAIRERAQELGVEYQQRSAVDFDASSLRRALPAMVAVIARSVARGKTVFVHCTAGLGRSPAAVIAYLFWLSEPKMDLKGAYDFVTSLRPCGPKWEAIKGATYDMARNSPYQPAFETLPSFAFSDVAEWERELIRSRTWGLA